MAQLLSNLPLGAKIKFGKHQINTETAESIVWRVVAKNHNGYPANSVTLIADNIIDLRTYDAQESSSWNSDEGVGNGYIDYKLSNIQQWLNSDAAAGEWYTAQHSNDKPPASTYTYYGTEYSLRPGFLNNFAEDERLALLPTTLTNAAHGRVASSSFSAKVFLPSLWEIQGSGQNSDGSFQFAYFVTNDRRASVTQQVVTNSLCTSKPTSVTYWKYWTRSVGLNDVRIINEEGNGDWNFAISGHIGVRPCINLASNTKISNSTDANGVYSLESNVAPTISGTNGNLGEKKIAFTQAYTVSDGDSDPITVTEYIDNVAIRSYVATLGATNTFTVSGTTWLKLTNGTHTLKIVATDGFSEDVRTYTFTKNVTSIVVERAEPIPSTTQPKSIIVTVVKNIPTEAIFKVEACNNGFDASPTWEDITADVNRGEIYDFTNTSKTATNWGVNIRVTVDRNGAEGACYITEIGGNFE